MRSYKDITTPLSKEDRAVLTSAGFGMLLLGMQVSGIAFHVRENPIDWYSIIGYGIGTILCCLWIQYPQSIAKVGLSINKWVNKDK